jgi:hypothetical protein
MPVHRLAFFQFTHPFNAHLFVNLLTHPAAHACPQIGDAYMVASGVLTQDQEGFRAIDSLHDPAFGAGRMLALAMQIMHTAIGVSDRSLCLYLTYLAYSTTPHGVWPSEIKTGVKHRTSSTVKESVGTL